MNATVPPALTVDAALDELACLGMRVARAIARMIEIEVEAAEVVASWLPERGSVAASLSEAVVAGQGVDAVNAATAEAGPRIEVLARAYDRVSRSVRRSYALLRRIEAGWPRAGADDRAAMVRRQVARGVGEAIRRQTDGEAAERLFDELAERLEESGFGAEIGDLPVTEVVRRICRELGLVAEALEAQLPGRTEGEPPEVDTG